MGSGLLRVAVLALVVAVNLTTVSPALAFPGSSVGACHHTCSAISKDRRKAAIATYIGCKQGCGTPRGTDPASCRAACFTARNAELAQIKVDYRQCMQTCVGSL